ncbi:MAG: DUF484 family protein [Gammaproteobacteria bacterium]|nr:DUF484 family protein [Gammaproteobacteria bacterium]
MNDVDNPGLDADAVADYLRRHPEFFQQHPALLAELEIPHDRGDAVSLVERQVAALREQNQKSRQRLLELFDIARRNQELATRMHQLALSLMDAGDPRDIFAALYDNLRANFNAGRVAVRLFAKPAFIDFYAGEEFAGPGVEEAKLFRAVIDKGRPLTGRLKRQQQVFLFGDGGDDIHSAVLVPLRGERWGGVLAIGSPDPTRFQEHMGVELLTNLGEMLSLILKPWISTK